MLLASFNCLDQSYDEAYRSSDQLCSKCIWTILSTWSSSCCITGTSRRRCFPIGASEATSSSPRSSLFLAPFTEPVVAYPCEAKSLPTMIFRRETCGLHIFLPTLTFCLAVSGALYHLLLLDGLTPCRACRSSPMDF